jgi:hypothetical protein
MLAGVPFLEVTGAGFCLAKALGGRRDSCPDSPKRYVELVKQFGGGLVGDATTAAWVYA